jgi:hypothetical protein
MKWYAWIAAAVLTALIGLLATGTLGGLLVDWYEVSSFEGGAGFFVIALALLGGIGGFVIGILAAAIVSRRPRPGFLKAAAAGCGAALAIVLVAGAVARLLADIPPTLQGETLYLQVELRWPASGQPAPASLPDEGLVRLGALRGSVLRRHVEGPLWLEDRRQEDGRWIVPGAVDIFTSRGRRALELVAGETTLAAFIVPLPGRPTSEHEAWSEWLPRASSGSPADPAGFTYRFKVVRLGQPVRVQQAGPFDVAAVADRFYRLSDIEGMGAHSVLRVSHNGQPIGDLQRADYVALVPGPRPTLFVRAEQADGAIVCAFVVDGDARPRIVTVGSCTSTAEVQAVTSDTARHRAARERKPLPGWLDRDTFAAPGLYHLDGTVLDTRTLTGRAFTLPSDPYPLMHLGPVTVSPDERSLVWIAHDGGDAHPTLVVTDTVAKQSYSVPVDPRRMRFSTPETLDPAWVAHHFAWTRAVDGIDRLVARTAFTVLPYRGLLSTGDAGPPAYTIRPGREPLREAILEILTAGLGGERLADDGSSFYRRVRLDGVTLHVSVIESESYVYVSPEPGQGNAAFMTRVAERLDAAFATGRWDHAFGWPDAPRQ